MDMEYMTLKEASEKWGVSSRQVNYYCVDGRIPGAVKMAGVCLLSKVSATPWIVAFWMWLSWNRMKVSIAEDNNLKLKLQGAGVQNNSLLLFQKDINS